MGKSRAEQADRDVGWMPEVRVENHSARVPTLHGVVLSKR
jgi:hypothetical protein